jgi:hypothetical protein
MLLKEFVSETNKSQMMSDLFKYYKVEGTKMKYKSMKDHAHYVVEDGVLLLSKRYKTLKTSQVKNFLITMIHEIKHAMDAKKYGWKRFKGMWEYEANLITQGHYKSKSDPYDDNKHELKAEAFGQANWKKWYNKFKKQNLI